MGGLGLALFAIPPLSLISMGLAVNVRSTLMILAWSIASTAYVGLLTLGLILMKMDWSA